MGAKVRARDMLTSQTHAHADNTSRLSRPMIIALIIGLGLGSVPILLWPHLAGPARWGNWSLAIAAGLLLIRQWYLQLHQEALWEMLIGGQLLCILAISLFWVASVA